MIPEWTLRLPMNLIYQKAIHFELDPLLVASLVYQESRGFVYAVRYEPAFRWVHRVDHFAKYQNITKETEQMLQKHSFGLLQVMGGTARSIGYDGALPALYKPENNLFWGCKFLSILKKKYPDKRDMVAAYNAGSVRKENGKYVNQRYVDEVFSRYDALFK